VERRVVRAALCALACAGCFDYDGLSSAYLADAPFSCSDGGSIGWMTNRQGGANLNGVAGAAGTYVAVGDTGTALYTQNAGVSWTPVDVGTTENLTDVWSDGTTFVAAGSGGTLLRSEGGRQWTADHSTAVNYSSLGGDRSDNLFAVGQDTVVSNRGGAWSPIRVFSTESLHAVWAQGDHVIVATDGFVHVSMDGGANWAPSIDVGIQGGVRELAGDGVWRVAVGDGGMAAWSSNGGLNWTPVQTPVNNALYGLWSDGGTLWAVGDGGVIVYSTDLGVTWTFYPLAVTNFFAVGGDCVAAFIVGQSGTILQRKQ
jgi:hypothetical protein